MWDTRSRFRPSGRRVKEGFHLRGGGGLYAVASEATQFLATSAPESFSDALSLSRLAQFYFGFFRGPSSSIVNEPGPLIYAPLTPYGLSLGASRDTAPRPTSR